MWGKRKPSWSYNETLVLSTIVVAKDHKIHDLVNLGSSPPSSKPDNPRYMYCPVSILSPNFFSNWSSSILII